MKSHWKEEKKRRRNPKETNEGRDTVKTSTKLTDKGPIATELCLTAMHLLAELDDVVAFEGRHEVLDHEHARSLRGLRHDGQVDGQGTWGSRVGVEEVRVLRQHLSAIRRRQKRMCHMLDHVGWHCKG